MSCNHPQALSTSVKQYTPGRHQVAANLDNSEVLGESLNSQALTPAACRGESLPDAAESIGPRNQPQARRKSARAVSAESWSRSVKAVCFSSGVAGCAFPVAVRPAAWRMLEV